MLQYLADYGKYIEITGFRKVAFDMAESFLKTKRKQQNQNGTDLQFFDADTIATQEHLYFAVVNALQAFQNKNNHSKTPAMETILYASAQKQIQKAIERCGINPQTKNLALVIIGLDPAQIESEVRVVSQSVGGKLDEGVLEMTKAKLAKIKKTFKINQTMLETVAKEGEQEKAIINLVIEQVALLSTQF